MGNHTVASAIAISAVIIGALAAPATKAQDRPATNSYTELLALDLKAGGYTWLLDKRYEQPDNEMMEYVPSGQTGQDWSEMLTTITFHGQPPANVANVIAGIVHNFRATCGKLDLSDQNAATGTDVLRKSVGLPATYQTFSVLLKCEDPKMSPSSTVTIKKHEVLWLKGIQGWLNSYLVERAWHGDTVAPNSILASDKTHREWQNWSQTIRIVGIPADKVP